MRTTTEQAPATTAPSSAPKRRYLLDRERFLGPAMLLPSVLYLAILVAFPLILAILYSFSDITVGKPGIRFTGWNTWKSVIHDPVFRSSLGNTVVFTLVSQILVVILSTILAHALSARFRGRWFARFLILLPWTTPIALGAISWLWMLDSIFSPLSWLLRHAGLVHGRIFWLGTTHLAMGSVIAVQTWRILPLATVILMAGMTSIPKDVKEQAEVDGAGFWRRLFGIEIPLLFPIIMVALLFGTVFTFTDMTVVFVLTRGGPSNGTQVLASWAFFRGIEGGSLAQGAAIALFMFPVLVGLAAVMLRLARRREVA